MQNGQAKNLHKKDHHVYNNCCQVRSRAIKKFFAMKTIKSTVMWTGQIKLIGCRINKHKP